MDFLLDYRVGIAIFAIGIAYWSFLGPISHAWPTPKSDVRRVRAQMGGSGREVLAVERDGTDFEVGRYGLRTWRCYRATIVEPDGTHYVRTVGVPTMDITGEPIKQIGRSPQLSKSPYD